MNTDINPPLSSEKLEMISAFRVRPLVASPSVTTSATTGRAGSRGSVSTLRKVRNTSVCPCAVSRPSHLSACSSVSDVTSFHAASGNAYENLSRNATTLNLSPEFSRRNASDTASRHFLKRSFAMEPDASSMNTMSFDTTGSGFSARDDMTMRKYLNCG